jgi:valyl-tRNA synthetase
MPFVTESVWDALPASGLDDHSAQFLMVAKWPEPASLLQFVNEQGRA